MDEKSSIFQQQQKEYEKLFGGRNFRHLRNLATSGKLKGCLIRSLVWKFFLGCLPSDVDLKEWPNILNVHRKEYSALLTQYVVDPHASRKDLDVKINHPLSLHEESPWSQFFQNAELEKEINQDIERTYPENEFFQRKDIREMMLRILFIYARQTPQLSYKQGMHELLAPILFVIAKDSVPLSIQQSNSDSLELGPLLSEEYIEHDAFTLFTHLMKIVKEWFISDLKQKRNANDYDEMTSPIVAKCRFVQNNILRERDLELFNHLQHLNVEPQLYMLRWMRLLLGREFHLEDVLILWDSIFGYSQDLRLIDYICAAMLIFIREQLLNSDYTNCMRRLFKYPPVEDVHLFVEKGKSYIETPMSALTQKEHTKEEQPATPATKIPLKDRLMEVKNLLNPSFEESPQQDRMKQLETKVEELKSTQKHMAHRLERLIYGLQKEVFENKGQNPSQESVLLTLAELKHIRDILMGLLPNTTIEDESL